MNCRVIIGVFLLYEVCTVHAAFNFDFLRLDNLYNYYPNGYTPTKTGSNNQQTSNNNSNDNNDGSTDNNKNSASNSDPQKTSGNEERPQGAFGVCHVDPLSAWSSCGPCLQHGPQELPALKGLTFSAHEGPVDHANSKADKNLWNPKELIHSDHLQCQKYKSINPMHTMCLKDKGRNRPLSEATKQAILQKHNELRGKVKPKAANMQKMIWDEELAVVAGKWARQCRVAHDQKTQRMIPSLPGMFIGQNGFFRYPSLDPVKAVQEWYDEVVDFRYGVGSINGRKVGHYTQVVHARTARVGCGLAYCPNSIYKNHFFCNYAIGQNGLTRPYKKSSQSCSACPNKCKGKLCDCGGKLCLNGGKLYLNTCKCSCSTSLYGGDVCDSVTCPKKDAWLCGGYWPKSYCKKYANVPSTCPHMCGIC